MGRVGSFLLVGAACAALAVAPNGSNDKTGAATATDQVALSSLTPVSAVNGWGPYEANRANGDRARGDGAPLTINGVRYSTGLGVHAFSSIRYNLAGAYKTFATSIGVDDEAKTAGSVAFQIYVDGLLKYSSTKMTFRDAARTVSLSVAGASSLRLEVTDSGDGNTWDHADWAGAVLTRGSVQTPTTAKTLTTAPPTKTTTTAAPPTLTTTSAAPPTLTTTSAATPTTSAPAPTTSTPSNPAPPPATGSYPDASNTGSSGALTSVGATTLSTNGATFQNMQVNGQLTVRADNVTIRNIKVVSGDFWVVIVYGKNLTISDSTLIGGDGTTASLAATAGGSFSATRINAYGAGDGIRLEDNSSLTDSYVHDLSQAAGVHNDGVTADGSTGYKIIHNTVLNNRDQTSAMMVANTAQPSNGLVQNNYVAGGGYTIYGGLATGSGVVFSGNVFSTRYFADSGNYGAVGYWDSNGNTWSNNTWADGPNKGKALSP